MTAAYSESTKAASFSTAREQFDSMTRHLESPVAFGMAHDELEAYVIEQGRELERRLLQEHLDLRAGARVIASIVGSFRSVRNGHKKRPCTGSALVVFPLRR
jgi:hypothetical protein